MRHIDRIAILNNCLHMFVSSMSGQIFGLLYLFLAAGETIALLVICQMYRRQIQTEQSFLKLQKLLAVQYDFIQHQMVWMKNSQELPLPHSAVAGLRTAFFNHFN